MNPNKFSAFTYNRLMKKYSFEKWYEDNKKIKFANSKGYEVKVVWASDYEKDREKVIRECKEFLFGS